VQNALQNRPYLMHHEVMNEILPLELFQAAFSHLQIYFLILFFQNKEEKQPVSSILRRIELVDKLQPDIESLLSFLQIFSDEFSVHRARRWNA